MSLFFFSHFISQILFVLINSRTGFEDFTLLLSLTTDFVDLDDLHSHVHSQDVNFKIDNLLRINFFNYHFFYAQSFVLLEYRAPHNEGLGKLNPVCIDISNIADANHWIGDFHWNLEVIRIQGFSYGDIHIRIPLYQIRPTVSSIFYKSYLLPFTKKIASIIFGWIKYLICNKNDSNETLNIGKHLFESAGLSIDYS